MCPSGISILLGTAKITSFHLTPTPPRNEETLGISPAVSTYIESVYGLMKAYKYESQRLRPPHIDLSSKGKQ